MPESPQQHKDPASERWITVAELTEPVEAELIGEVLKAEGVPFTMPGVQHRAMLGVLGGYVRIVVQVPLSEAERARGLVNAFRLSGAVSEAEAGEAAAEHRSEAYAESDDEIPNATQVTPRSAKVAVGASLLGSCILMSAGAGHLYVRQYRTAVALFILGWTALFAMFYGLETWPAVGLLLLLDGVGAAVAARQSQRGRVVLPNRHGLAITALAMTVLALSPMLARFLSIHFPSSADGDRAPIPEGSDWDGSSR